MPSFRELVPHVWSELEFGACELGDKRRTRRLVRYACQMAEKPDASTPEQTETWADCKGAYRLFEQPEVTFEAVTANHYRRTGQLAAREYLVISDTTELDYGYKSTRTGLGRLASGQHRGFFLHSALVVQADNRQVIGLGAQELYTRSTKKLKRVHRVKARKRPTESEVWGRVMDRVQPAKAGVKLIHVCDRGADNFDVFAHLQVKDDSWVIRAAQLTRKVRHADEVRKLAEVLDLLPSLGSYEVYVAANNKQPARWAKVEVRATEITLLRPREGCTPFVMDQNIKEIPCNVVEVREMDAPQGCTPVRWVLYTAEVAASFEQSMRVIGIYEQRPLIEEYHKCMKTGLQVEQRQYQSSDRLEAVIGVICIQAVRLLQLRDVSRLAPDTPAESLVPPDWLFVLRKITKSPRPIRTMRDFLHTLAGLGGFLRRTHDGEPGWITIWRGLNSLIMALRGYRAAKQKCG